MDAIQAQYYYGSNRELPQKTYLRAGPLSLVYENGDLRYVKVGDTEVVAHADKNRIDKNTVISCLHAGLIMVVLLCDKS